jgi:general secretion pathway protein G
MKTMNARKSGFTLVELLIVIMIISILAGMMLLATGSATDGAEAIKIVNDLRNLKSAALLYYADNMRWPMKGQEASLDQYTDRPVVSNRARYVSVVIGDQYPDPTTQTIRYNIGVQLDANKNGTPGVQRKLQAKAVDTGLLSDEKNATNPYIFGSDWVWVNMR